MTNDVFTIEDAITAIIKYTKIVEEYIITLGGAVRADK